MYVDSSFVDNRDRHSEKNNIGKNHIKKKFK